MINSRYLIFIGLFIIVMFTLTTFGLRGIMRIHSLTKEKDQIVTLNKKLSEENHRLKDTIHSLRTDRKYIEDIARQELGLVKEDEIVYQFETSAQ